MSRNVTERKLGKTSDAGVREVYPSATGLANRGKITTSDGTYPATEADTRSGYCAQCGSPHEDIYVLTECTECGSNNLRGEYIG